MTSQPQQPQFYSQIDVSHGSANASQEIGYSEMRLLLRELLQAQDRQNELLEELVAQMSCTQRQRAAELAAWKQQNPQLASSCRQAAEVLGRVQTEYLASLTEEIRESAEHLGESEFMLNEFIDRFGPRTAHLNGLLQVLGQLGAQPGSASTGS